MKKNNMLRIASVLLVAVLLSTCAISGAFAKYTTDVASKTDTARVAKWDITATATTNDLFADTYKNGDVVTVKIETDGTDKLVAPGTGAKASSIEFRGTAEVAVAIEKTVKVDLSNWNVTAGEYCPIIFTVNGGSEIKFVDTVENLEIALVKAILGVDNLEDPVDGAYTATGATIAPNTALSAANDVTVEWEWPFSVNDTNDTELGKAAYAGNAPTITIEVSAKVVQVD